MKIPNFKPPKQPDLDIDGNDLDAIAWQRVAVRDKRLSMPARAARLDNLPKEYRIGLPKDVDDARKQYKEFLVNGHGTG